MEASLPRYVDEEGFYLGIDRISEGFRLGWVVSGEELRYTIHNLSEPCDPDNKIAQKALLRFCELNGVPIPPKGCWFLFKDVGLAQKALWVVNALLHYRELPDWAHEALVQGWTPPKGWTL